MLILIISVMTLYNVVTNVSEESTGSVFRVEAGFLLETLAIIYEITRCHKPVDHNLRRHRLNCQLF
jgi:hypothetical protein